jgi:tetratricopeptide (TPR) repeat protein
MTTEERQQNGEAMGPENLRRKDNVPERDDYRRIEEIARVVLQVVESEKGLEPKQTSRLTRALNQLSSNWVIVAFLLSTSAILLSWFVFGISPFYEQQKLAQERARLERMNSLAEQHVDIGNTFLNVGSTEAAKQEFEQALDIAPGNEAAAKGAYKVDVFEDVEGQYDPGVTLQRLSLLLEQYPNDTHAYAFRGTVRYQEVVPDPNLPPDAQQDELYQPALSDLEKAVHLNESNAYAYNSIADIYYDLGQYDTTLKYAEKAYHLYSRDLSYKHDYANALYANKHYKDAIEEYEEITLLDWQFMLPYHDLAQLYRLTDFPDLYSSQWYYEQFIDMLEDNEITSLDKNQGGFGFTTGPDSPPVYLVENPEIRYYAYYSIALTSYLLGQTEDAERYVNEAKDIQVNPNLEAEVQRLLEYDVKVLQEEHPELNANDFSKKYLT